MTYSLSVVDARQLSRINEAVGLLVPADSLAELVRQAPVLLCQAGDFDRALISRVRGSTWTPMALHVAVGAAEDVNVALAVTLRTLQIPLTGSLAETEVLRHRVPMLVEPTLAEAAPPAPRAPEGERLAGLLRSRAYVVAPVVIGDRVAGFLHADTYMSGRELTVADRAGIQLFTAMFGLLYERAAMRQRLRDQQQAVAAAVAAGIQGETGPDVARLARTQVRSADRDRRDAVRLGLVNHVVPDTDLREAVQRLALRIAANAPLSVRAAKRTVRLIAEQPLSAAYEEAERIWAPVYTSEDAQEGPAAFRDKRPPVWEGR